MMDLDTAIDPCEPVLDPTSCSLEHLLLGCLSLTPITLIQAIQMLNRKHGSALFVDDITWTGRPSLRMRRAWQALMAAGWCDITKSGVVLTPLGEERLKQFWREQVMLPHIAKFAVMHGEVAACLMAKMIERELR